MNKKKEILMIVFALSGLFALGSLFNSNSAFAEAPSPSTTEVSSPPDHYQFIGNPTDDRYTYQGQLTNGGVPYNGTCDFEFDHWDALSGGNQIDTSQQAVNVLVQDGLFNVEIASEFLFTGFARWLEISVRCPAGSGGFTHLNPRQALTAAPYAQGLTPGAYIAGDVPLSMLGVSNGTGVALELISWLDDGIQMYAGGSGVFVNYAGEDGVHICSTGSFALPCVPHSGSHGVEIGQAFNDGVHITSANDAGLFVNEAWTGIDVISVTQGININYAGDTGVYVGSANRGLHVGGAQTGLLVDAAGGTGIEVLWSGGDGVNVVSALGNGVEIGDAGLNGVQINQAAGIGVEVGTANWGFNIQNAANYGLLVGYAGAYGVEVTQSVGDAFFACHAGNVWCGNDSGTNGFEVGGAEEDGFRVNFSQDDGIQIGSFTFNRTSNYGLFTASPGVTNTALLVQTQNVNGEWALSTPDKISAANVTLGSMTLYAQVDGPDPLLPGDLVAVSGMAAPLPNSLTEIPLVRLADESVWTGVIGVVESRMVLQSPPGKEEEGVLSLYSIEGAAQPGDYIALTVYGIAQVKVAPGTSIAPGERLTAASFSGHARPLKSELLNGMTVTEGAPVIGIALSEGNPATGLVSVFVTLR